jgi:hypothetical protein
MAETLSWTLPDTLLRHEREFATHTLELVIVPDIGGGDAIASLKEMRVL